MADEEKKELSKTDMKKTKGGMIATADSAAKPTGKLANDTIPAGKVKDVGTGMQQENRQFT